VLRGRWQDYREARSTLPTDSETIGLQLTGPWLGSSAVDAFLTTRERDDGSSRGSGSPSREGGDGR
jgi:hypothetical protein